MRTGIAVLAILLMAGLGGVAQEAKAQQDSMGALRDVLKKAQEDLKRLHAPDGQPPAPSLPGAGPVAGGAPTRQGGAAPVTLDDLAKAPPGPVSEINWRSMPKVLGIHLGMPVDAATAALKREYPKGRLQAWEIAPQHRPTIDKPVSNGVTLRPDAATPYGDQVELHFLHPPNPHIVFAVSRLAQRQHVHRGTLLASLRKKYGQESARNPDALITDLWWVFDEQGRPADAPRDGILALGNCQWPTVGGSIDDMKRNRQSPWCESSHIAVHARFDSHNDPEIVETLHMRMIHLPLGLRAAAATIAWRDAMHDKQRQQEIERSKQATPRL